jgi:hypothetical protein
MLNFNEIAVEPELARTGVWTEYMGGRFLVARRGSAHREALVALYGEIKEEVAKDPHSEDSQKKTLEVYAKAFAQACLLDWQGIIDDKRQPIPYTPELGAKMMLDPRLNELAMYLEQFSLIHGNYQAKIEQEIAEDVKPSADS